MISVENLNKSFKTADGERSVLKNVSLKISEGETVVIGGENGSGKSVLMNIIAGLEKVDSGKIEVSEKIGYVFQEAETQILGETVLEDVSFGPKNLKFSKEKINENVKKALEITRLTDKQNYTARFLSGGEKRRLAIACMLSMDLPVLILDEPYANLDYCGVKQVNSLIKELQNQKKTVIILTHEIEKCLALSKRFVVLFRGEIKFDGKSEDAVKMNLEQWNIKNPLNSYKKLDDLVWL